MSDRGKPGALTKGEDTVVKAGSTHVQDGGFFDEWRGWLMVLLITLSATLPLFWNTSADFGSDWPCHIYLAGYQAEFFRQHGYFAQLLNTDWISGLPYPVFYGHLLYPILALPAAAFGADPALRIAAFLLLFVQTRQVIQLIRATRAPIPIVCLVAFAVTGATYSLTNLYNRGAFTEFAAVALLTCATAAFLRPLMPFETGSRGRLILQGSFFFGIAASAHPITAFYGTIFLGIIVTPLVYRCNRALLFWYSGGAILALVILGPWLFAMMKFHGKLSIQRNDMVKIVHFSDSLDAPINRFWLVPRDPRVRPGVPVSTVFLDAQCNLTLLLLTGWLVMAILQARRQMTFPAGPGLFIAAIAMLVFAVTAVLSVAPALWIGIPKVFHSMQYAYRLVTYQNLALLVTVVGLLVVLGPGCERCELPRRQLGLAILGALVGIGLFVKLNHAFVVQRSPGDDELDQRLNPARLVHIPASFYGWSDYSVTGEGDGGIPGRKLHFPVGVGPSFGYTSPLRFDLKTPDTVCLQVQPFPWNHVVLDGKPLGPPEAHLRREGYVVNLPAGAHEVVARWEPPSVWVWLDTISKFGAVFWFLLLVGFRLREKTLSRS